METTQIKQNINLLCITASTFPSGVMAAHKQLHGLLPANPQRKYYGLSRPENGGSIVYRAAAEALNTHEARDLQLEEVVLQSGSYACMLVTDYMTSINAIGNAFQQLLTIPGIDPNGYCVEAYFNDTDVMCMVRLAQ